MRIIDTDTQTHAQVKRPVLSMIIVENYQIVDYSSSLKSFHYLNMELAVLN